MKIWKIHHFDGIYQERWGFSGYVSFREGILPFHHLNYPHQWIPGEFIRSDSLKIPLLNYQHRLFGRGITYMIIL